MTSIIPASSKDLGQQRNSLPGNGQPKNENKISERIRARLVAEDVSFLANDNIAEHIQPGELKELEVEVADRVRELLQSLVIDIDNDHNTQETAERVARMYLNEVFKGRFYEQPDVTSFPNTKDLDEIYTVGPITVRSACSHHLVPILGNCWIGIKPGSRVIGCESLREWLAGSFQGHISRKKL